MHDCKNCGVPVYSRIDRRGAAADAWLIEERTGAWHTCCRFVVGDLNIYEPEPPPVKENTPVTERQKQTRLRTLDGGR